MIADFATSPRSCVAWACRYTDSGDGAAAVSRNIRNSSSSTEVLRRPKIRPIADRVSHSVAPGVAGRGFRCECECQRTRRIGLRSGHRLEKIERFPELDPQEVDPAASDRQQHLAEMNDAEVRH